MNLQDVDIQSMVKRILHSRKYRDSGLNPTTIKDLIQQEAPLHRSQKTLRKSVRRKLHNIVAPYLGEPGYASLAERLSNIKDATPNSLAIRALCLEVLEAHASTAERIPYMTAFYQRLFDAAGKPKSILDLACGFHPLAFPWMNLPITTEVHAYDIIQPRIDFTNQFFRVIGLAPLAENRDILVEPPQIHADLGIFFKEAHRFDKRQPGCNRKFWANLNVDILAVSLPTQNLSGTHSLLDQHRSLVNDNLPEDSNVEELLYEDEIVFLIERPGK